MLLQGLPPSFGASNVVDLGCGVGASLCYLAARLPVRGTGITLSPVQARFAEQRIRKSGFADRIRCIEGDYCDLPPGTGPADLAYAIESFVHVVRIPLASSRNVTAFFDRAGCSSSATTFCDRPVSRRPRTRSNASVADGTSTPSSSRDELRSLARAAGFEHESTTDLSPLSRASARARPDRPTCCSRCLDGSRWTRLDAATWRAAALFRRASSEDGSVTIWRCFGASTSGAYPLIRDHCSAGLQTCPSPLGMQD